MRRFILAIAAVLLVSTASQAANGRLICAVLRPVQTFRNNHPNYQPLHPLENLKHLVEKIKNKRDTGGVMLVAPLSNTDAVPAPRPVFDFPQPAAAVKSTINRLVPFSLPLSGSACGPNGCPK